MAQLASLAASWLVAACCLLSAGGCTICHSALRTVMCEPVKYCHEVDRVRSLDTYREWAKQAWRQESMNCAGVIHEADYYAGFREGFVQYIFAGGTGQPPPIPPRKYWRLGFRSPAGHERAAQWSEGYRHGSRVAMERGYREIETVSSTFAMSGTEDYGPGYGPDTPLIDMSGEHVIEADDLPLPGSSPTPTPTPAQTPSDAPAEQPTPRPSPPPELKIVPPQPADGAAPSEQPAAASSSRKDHLAQAAGEWTVEDFQPFATVKQAKHVESPRDNVNPFGATLPAAIKPAARPAKAAVRADATNSSAVRVVRVAARQRTEGEPKTRLIVAQPPVERDSAISAASTTLRLKVNASEKKPETIPRAATTSRVTR